MLTMNVDVCNVREELRFIWKGGGFETSGEGGQGGRGNYATKPAKLLRPTVARQRAFLLFFPIAPPLFRYELFLFKYPCICSAFAG